MRLHYVATFFVFSVAPAMAQSAVMTVRVSHRQILVERREALEARQEELAERVQERAALRQGPLKARQAMAIGQETAVPLRAY
jgi:hypothetical protein